MVNYLLAIGQRLRRFLVSLRGRTTEVQMRTAFEPEAGPRSDTSDVTRAESTTVIAIDWSGNARRSEARSKIWRAEVVNRELTSVTNGLDRQETIDYLIEKTSTIPGLIVGLDFSFSFPQWFLDHLGVATASESRDMVVRDGEGWLADPQSPFWRQAKPEIPQEFRRTALESHDLTDLQPASIFKLVGADQVGPGSLRDMVQLARLKAAGFSIWPFDPPQLPMVVEIWPRGLYGNVVKTQDEARRSYLTEYWPNLSQESEDLVSKNDDSFDAAVSALFMGRNIEHLLRGGFHTGPYHRTEGRIWLQPTREGFKPR
jgi:hypothetical protein